MWPFFVALVAFGSFYIINLALAVLFMQFSNDNHADDPSKKKSGRQGSGDGQRQGDKAGAGGGGAANSGGEHKDSDSESSMSDVGSEEDERLRPTMAEVTGLRTVGQHSTKLVRWRLERAMGEGLRAGLKALSGLVSCGQWVP